MTEQLPPTVCQAREPLPEWFAFLTEGGDLVVIDQTSGSACLGRGGMGTVYAGELTDRYGNNCGTVAVKHGHPAHERDIFREAAYMQQVECAAVTHDRHPGVPRALAVVYNSLGAFMVQECLTGECLRTLIAQGRVTLEIALQITGNLLHTVMMMEAAEPPAGDTEYKGPVIHLDLTPDNVSHNLATGETQVYDFGIARGQFAPPVIEHGMTRGSPIWMAPEQTVNLDDTDLRTNVFQVGLNIINMVTGGWYKVLRVGARRRPLDDLNINSSGQYKEVVERAFEQYNKSHPDNPLPADLIAIMRKATALKPDDRHNSAHELYDDLAQHGFLPPLDELTAAA